MASMRMLDRQGAQVNEVVYGNTSLDLSSGMLICGSNSVRLSAREFDIMRFLLLQNQKVIDSQLSIFFTGFPVICNFHFKALLG